MTNWNPLSSEFWDLSDEDSPVRGGVLGVTGGVIAPFYALGGGINALTGGTTPTYNVFDAAGVDLPAPIKPLAGPAGWTEREDYTPPPATYSPVTQALSGYQGDTPGSGTWGLPIFNPSTPRVVGDILDATTKGLLGLDLKTVALIAGGIAALALLPRSSDRASS